MLAPYVGSLCYADDIALLAPLPSALRILDDSDDIKRATLEMCKKANIVLSTFSSCDPHQDGHL